MLVIDNNIEVGNHSNRLKSQGKKLGFVPTMGAIHAGHLSLIDEVKKHCDYVIASIFVNPVQFAEHEDFGSYPRNFEEDIKSLDGVGCDAVFAPSEKDIYPNGRPEAKNIVDKNANILCGISRPHFFHGVWIVVSRLFEIINPDIAIFGEKDFQQLQIIRQMSEKTFPQIKIIGAPIIREKNGLAMSSRNQYLSGEERIIAAELNRELKSLAVKIKNNENISILIEETKNLLLKKGFDKIDYLEVRDSKTLLKSNDLKQNLRIFVAATLGKTRLIDNWPI